MVLRNGPSMAAPRCTRPTVTRQRRLLAPSFWGNQTQTRLEQKRWWNSLEIIKLYCRNEKSGLLQAFLRSNLVGLFVVIIGEHLKELMHHLSNLSSCARGLG
jgi:hypothetical protein